MVFDSEDEVKKALGITSWRNLSKDNVVKFAAMRPDMNKDVAQVIVAQLPMFTRLGLDVMESMRKAHDSTLGSNRHSQDRVHDSLAEVREMAKEELKRDDLSPEERRHYHEAAKETAQKEFEKDSENKRFLDGLFGKTVTVAGIVVAAGVAFAGGRAAVQRGDDTAGTRDA
jgi:hypothetical protein